MEGSVFITGSSTGIGLETARLFRDKGAKVVATARKPEVLADEESENLVAIACDVTDAASVDGAVVEAEKRMGPIDAVINNAGYGQPGPIEEVTEEEVRAQFDTNVFGALRVIRATTPLLRERGRGTIVNISSLGGKISSPFLGIYSATKFALEAISDSLRVELRPFGVRVVIIEPGPIKTEFGERARSESDRFLKNPDDSAYGKYLGGADRGADMLDWFELGPDAVAKTIYSAVNARSPRTRYSVTLPAVVGGVASRFVPDAVRDFALARTLGL